MSNGETSTQTSWILTIIGAVLGSVLTIVGQPYINEKFEERKTPQLVKETISHNLNYLPNDVKEQITIVSTRYSLENVSGGTAEDITITITSDSNFPDKAIVINPQSEKYQLNSTDHKIKKIEVPNIRPSGIVSFEITHNPQNHISISEVIRTGVILSSDATRQDGDNSWWQYVLLLLFIFFWVGLIWLFYISLSKGAKYFLSLDKGEEIEVNENFRSKFSVILVAILCINLLAGMNLGLIDIPHIPIRDIFYALVIYILVINYKSLKAILKKLSD